MNVVAKDTVKLDLVESLYDDKCDMIWSTSRSYYDINHVNLCMPLF